MGVAHRANDRNSNADATARRVEVRDKFTLTERTINAQGFLVAPAKLARTGIQTYSARELGLDEMRGMDSNAPVRLYRPHEEVFSPEALASFEGVTLTVDHPATDVTAETWGDVAVGDVHGITAADPYVGAKVIVRDPEGIAAVQSGKSELSMGYSFELDLTPGTAADGSAYDGVMRAIRGNHASIVDFGRAGHACRIADSKNKEKPMARKVIVDGIGIDLEDTHAAIVEKTLAAKDVALKSATEARDAAEARAKKAEDAGVVAADASKKLVADHAAEVEKLKAQILTADAVEALVEERTKVVADASSLVEGIVTKGKAITAICTEALSSVTATDASVKALVDAFLDGVELAKADAKDVRRAFNAVVSQRSNATATDAGTSANDAQSRALLGAAANDGATKLTGRAAMMARMQNGGKLPGEASA